MLKDPQIPKVTPDVSECLAPHMTLILHENHDYWAWHIIIQVTELCPQKHSACYCHSTARSLQPRPERDQDDVLLCWDGCARICSTYNIKLEAMTNWPNWGLTRQPGVCEESHMQCSNQLIFLRAIATVLF